MPLDFDPKQHYELARCLRERCPIESSLDDTMFRTAINRAYYSVFLKARSLADYHANEDVGHRYLSDKYKADKLTERKLIGNLLYSLYAVRHEADYHLDLEGDIGIKAQTAMELADQIWQMLEDLEQQGLAW